MRLAPVDCGEKPTINSPKTGSLLISLGRERIASQMRSAASSGLIVGKWSAAPRQNTLAAALKEWGMLRRTIHTPAQTITKASSVPISKAVSNASPEY